MDEPVFANKAKQPKDVDLAEVLGTAKKHWDTFVAAVAAAAPDAKPEWKFYSGKSGWVFLFRGKKRNVVYMRPMIKVFLVSFTFSEKAVAAVEQSDLPAELVESIRRSPRYPEGRPARLNVKTAKDAKIAKQLLAIKLEN